jgi:translation initiation factor IF-2
MPVTVSGWKELPQAGDEMLEGKENEVKAAVFNRKRKLGLETLALDVKSINEKRTKEKEREAEVAFAITNISSRSSKRTTIAPSPALMPDISVETTGAEELRLIIKADVSGSAEAVTAALQDIGNHVAKVKIISTSVGEPSEADVDMARAVSGTCSSFFAFGPSLSPFFACHP